MSGDALLLAIGQAFLFAGLLFLVRGWLRAGARCFRGGTSELPSPWSSSRSPSRSHQWAWTWLTAIDDPEIEGVGVDPDTVFLSYLAVLAVVGIVLVVVEKRRPGQTWNPSPAWFATLTVAIGLLPLQIYLVWDGDAPTTGFIVLCVVADVGLWGWAYFVRKKRQRSLADPSWPRLPGTGRGR